MCWASPLTDVLNPHLIIGGIIAVYVLVLILATVFTFSPNQSGTTDSSQPIESIVEKE